MEIVRSKTLEGRVHEVKLSGVILTLNGDTAVIIANQSENRFNVAIGYGIRRVNPKKINPRCYVLHTMTSKEIVEDLYNNLR